MAVKFVYVTIGCADEAEQLAAEIINKQLAACANIISGMTSVFKWNGKIQTSSETIILFKTTKACTESLINRIKISLCIKTGLQVKLKKTNLKKM